MKRIVLFLIVIAVIVFGTLKLTDYISKNKSVNDSEVGGVHQSYLQVNDLKIPVTVASTQEERLAGLSGVESLPEDEGMLFVFDEFGVYRFWMKDMLFPLDIAWIDQFSNIIYTVENVGPETYPESFGPNDNALYVLEVNAGFFEKNGITIDQSVTYIP